MRKKDYVMPSIEVVSVRIEKGFASSVPVANDYAADGEAGMLEQGETYEW